MADFPPAPVPLVHANPTEQLRQIAARINQSFLIDGSTRMLQPLKLSSYVVASLPDASLWVGSMIYVSDESGGATMAFSDGTNWRRVQDRAIVS